MPQAVFRVRPVARCTASMAGHSESVLVVAFSPDGRGLATGSGDTTLRFWDLNTQLPQFECKVRDSLCSWHRGRGILCVCLADAGEVAGTALVPSSWEAKTPGCAESK